uniref:Globin-2 n=2 Tax=Phreagena soyoae TaxID=1298647 RepID=GLB2_PHRSO|nr:RecName: Full=Globin-2; AltName: Full=Globin II; AltName: Full=Hb II [Phreagena soyoae]
VSQADIAAVQTSWRRCYCSWDNEDGLKFYQTLFDSNSKIRHAFESAGATNDTEMEKQANLFGLMMTQFIDNLDDTTALNYKISGLMATHKTRNVVDPALFAIALNELVKFIGNQQPAWKNVTAVILSQMKIALSSN